MNLSTAASIVTVLAVLLMVEYSPGAYDAWDILISICALFVFRKTMRGWLDQAFIRLLVSVGVGICLAVLLAGFGKAWELYGKGGIRALFDPQERAWESFIFIDKAFVLAVFGAVVTLVVLEFRARRSKSERKGNTS